MFVSLLDHDGRLVKVGASGVVNGLVHLRIKVVGQLVVFKVLLCERGDALDLLLISEVLVVERGASQDPQELDALRVKEIVVAFVND